MRSDGSIYEGPKENKADVELAHAIVDQMKDLSNEERLDLQISIDFEKAYQGKKLDIYNKLKLQAAFRLGWLARNEHVK